MPGEFQSTVLDALQGGVLVTDREGRTAYVNAWLAHRLGTTPDDLIGKSVLDLVEPDRVSEAKERVRSRADGSVGGGRWTLRGSNGETLLATVRSGPCQLPDGQVGVVAFVHDIAEVVAAQERADASTRRLRRSLDMGQLALWEWHRGVVQWSGAIEEIYGIPPSEFPTSDPEYTALIHPDDREGVAAWYWRLMSGHGERRTLKARYRIIRPDGAVVMIEATGVVMCDTDGRPDEAYGTIRDVSAHHALEVNLSSTQRHQAAREVTAAAVHEVNNLLMAIQASAEVGLMGDTPPDVLRQDAEVIVRAAKHAGRLLRSTLETIRERSRPRTLDLVRHLRVNASLLRSMVRPGSVELIAEGTAVVEIDPGELNQVLVNLLLNGLQAVPERTPPELTVSVEHRSLDRQHRGVLPGRWVVLSVADNGAGMDEVTADRVFEPFFTTKHDGTGMGLAAVSAIVRSASGVITVDSEPGVGTTMNVWLPRRVAALPSARSFTDHDPEDHRGRLLLVEPHDMLRAAVARRLSQLGFEVAGARDGLEGMARLHEGAAAAVITEAELPRTDLLEFIEVARRHQPHLPFVLCTDQPASLPAEALAQANTFTLHKPYDVRALDQLLVEVLADEG